MGPTVTAGGGMADGGTAGRGPGTGRLRGGGDGGSVLILVPTAFLVLIILGAIAVDSAIVMMAQRDLANRTAAAANDIAGLAVADDAFYAGPAPGSIELTQDRATRYVSVAFPPDRPPAGLLRWDALAVTDGRRVVVTATAEVPYLFAPAIPGVARTATVTARSQATASGG